MRGITSGVLDQPELQNSIPSHSILNLSLSIAFRVLKVYSFVNHDNISTAFWIVSLFCLFFAKGLVVIFHIPDIIFQFGLVAFAKLLSSTGFHQLIFTEILWFFSRSQIALLRVPELNIQCSHFATIVLKFPQFEKVTKKSCFKKRPLVPPDDPPTQVFVLLKQLLSRTVFCPGLSV